MASSSSVQKSFKYDVFLSFRGEDVRKTFVDYLYLALANKCIITYKDDEKIDKGERISEQLIRSIEESRFYIIVFSKNYESSSWCLDELVKIMECQETAEQTAYPVFYDVEPTEVRHQSGVVGKAFAKHVEKVEAWRWRDALREAASLAGWELKNTVDGHEAKFIQGIVKYISLKPHFINSSFDGKLVGMGSRVANVVSSLEINSNDVRMIGIKGMGGGGKTTLARAIFDNISHWFEGKSFVENVRKASKGSGLKELQKQILLAVLNDQSIVVQGVSDGKNIMKKMMPSRKVLVVLDDVDDIDQLEALAGEPNWFRPGSRIIITTRDEHVLVAHGVNFIHDVSLLSNVEATSLFNRYAFKKGESPNQVYEELSRKVVHYAAGLPLTIKVFGSHLFGRLEHEWVDAIERLKTIPLDKTFKRLEISYNGLENDEKEIFLDVACILKGEVKDKAIRILESCGYNAQIGLRVLEQKSLITISRNYLSMHDHIEEMGWNIVRRLHPNEPSRHTRLWIKEEIEDILVNESGTETTRSIKLKNTDLHTAIIMKGLKKMRELRFLYVDGSFGEKEVDEVNKYLPDSLRSLSWGGLYTGCLPKTFRANNLANLEIYGSDISQLQEAGERKRLNKLKYLEVSSSEFRTFDLGITPNLKRLTLSSYGFVELHFPVKCRNLKFIDLSKSKVSNFNLGMAPNLENLNFQGCRDLVELHMPVYSLKLKVLNLGGSKVRNLNLGMTPHLEKLDLQECNDFVEFHTPIECPKLKDLNLSYTKVSNLNLWMTPHLEKLDLQGCKDFVEFHTPIECPKLKDLNLSGTKVSNLNLEMTPRLKKLDLQQCKNFVELHTPIECPKLKDLNLSGSKVSNLNLGMTPCLEKLDLQRCEDFVELHTPIECPKLKDLNLSGSKVSDLNLGMTPHLEKLNLQRCKKILELHMPIKCTKLKDLNLSGTKVSNLNLWLTPNLNRLDLMKCFYLQKVHGPVGFLEKLVFLDLVGCSRFKYFQLLNEHEITYLLSLDTLKLTLVDMRPLHPNNYLPEFWLKCEYDECGPSRSNLESTSASIGGLQHLRKLTLKGNIPEVPKDLCQLESLEKLTLSMEEIQHLPDDIYMLKNLKILKLKSCLLLEHLPENICRLDGLEELKISGCRSLQDIPNNMCKMKCIKVLHLFNCHQVEKLPEELERLECLKELDIGGSGVTCLPQSIYQLKGLRIIGYREQLQSYGFTSITELFPGSTLICYTEL